MILLLLFTCFTVEAANRNTDIVVMKNGDRLTGQVKKLESGVLYVDLDYVWGSVGVDWNQVDEVQSSGVYQVTLDNGEHLIGTLSKTAEGAGNNKDVSIVSASRLVTVPAASVVQVESAKSTFWRQLTGSIDFGTSYTSGNSETSLNSDADVNYPARNWSAGASYTSSFSGQSGSSQTNLQELEAGAERYLNRNSFLLGLADFLHSSQQDLNIRTTLGGAYGRYWLRTNENTLRWFGGAVYTHEDFKSSSGQPIQQNLEALLGAQYELYRFNRYTLQSQLLVYPGLSDRGRVRTTTKTTLSVKLQNNFSLSFSFWDNFDSRPPVNAKRNELGVSSSVGWTF